MRRYAGQLNYCYERRLKTLPDLAGTMTVSWTVEAGRVVATGYDSRDMDDDDLATCVMKKVKRWSFAEDFSGDLSYDFAFAPR